ncbi:heparin lyase I family protein [Microbacterium marinilacus]|uniref:Heparin lyase I family protein n=1 Tax=Microbacterium marinilacus TaxID=415209 RepID=A0ABP7BDU8_9MICO|nr:heparin lyase I family protein [Microbacterium marinilacus]MBY0689386.1 polysaccharide lyase [Microbacterium marinilacus]
MTLPCTPAPVASRTLRPRRRAPLAVTAGAAALALVLAAAPARADVIWQGGSADGAGVFGTIECDDPGVLSVVDGAFRFQKSVGTYRCEARGVRADGERLAFAEDETYWLGWTQSLELVPDATQGDWVAWQWKSYPNADQNYPLLLRVQSGELRLTYVAPGEVWTTIWSAPVSELDEHRVAIGIHTSATEADGWVELYYDGERQTFADGSTRYAGRTWDSANEPKWGAYDRDNTAFEIANRVSDLVIGTTKEDVL